MKGSASANHLVQDRSECEDVRTMIDLLALNLLRRHVLRRSDNRVRLGESEGMGFRRLRYRAFRLFFRKAEMIPDPESMTFPGFKSRWTIPRE